MAEADQIAFMLYHRDSEAALPVLNQGGLS